MATPEIKKQISLFLPLSTWRVIRIAAARRRIRITQLVNEWIAPHVAAAAAANQMETEDATL